MIRIQIRNFRVYKQQKNVTKTRIVQLRNTRKQVLNPFSSHADLHSALIDSDVPTRLPKWEQIQF